MNEITANFVSKALKLTMAIDEQGGDAGALSPQLGDTTQATVEVTLDEATKALTKFLVEAVKMPEATAELTAGVVLAPVAQATENRVMDALLDPDFFSIIISTQKGEM